MFMTHLFLSSRSSNQVPLLLFLKNYGENTGSILTEMAYIAKTTQFVTVKSSQIVVKIRELTTRIFIRPDIRKTVDFSGVKKLMPL